MKGQIYKDCPICKLSNQEIVKSNDHGDKLTYKCRRCGRFEISSSAETVAKRNKKAAQLSGWLKERHLLGVEIPMLTSIFLNDVIGTLPSYNPSEKMNKLLKALTYMTSKTPGNIIPLKDPEDLSLAWAQDTNEFAFYITSLEDRGLASFCDHGGDKIPWMVGQLAQRGDVYATITMNGWEYLERDQSTFASKTQAFVAMCFDKDLKQFYDKAIAPSIESTGYRAYRVDTQPHNDRIDAKIIAEIKNSRFVVADVTRHKAGVYYEAGFAQGLGIPVIWCVSKKDLEKVHFDTRQYFHICYETEEELKEKLRDAILAIIGKKGASV